jgi:long-chain acyl-CoA synthetase
VSAPTIATAREQLGEVAQSFTHLFLSRVEKSPDRVAFTFPERSGMGSLTWAQTADRARRIAGGLISLGVDMEERVAITSTTRIEWLLADLGVMLCGGATTTVYPSTGADDVAYILSDSKTKVVFAEDDEQIAKLKDKRGELPALVKVVTFDGTPDGDWVLSLDDLEALGAELLKENPDAVDERVAKLGPDSLATLIYTSGTTGRPKGVELLHSCWAFEGASVDSTNILKPEDVQYLWLPLSHSFGKVLQAVQIACGFQTYVDGRIDKIVENIGEIKPTFMAGAPRIFEKIYGRVNSMSEADGGLKHSIYSWAVGVGRRVARAQSEGRSPSALDSAQFKIADALVFTKVRQRMGGHIRFFVSGSAALSSDVAEWFAAAGMPILEGYGLTETSAGSCILRPDSLSFGSVGEPFPGMEFRIAADGEILVKGPGVMRGYHNLPEQTAEAFPEGVGNWFATGDIGELDDLGRLRITDRKKDLVKTSGGKYISPQSIEASFKAVCPVASQMVVVVRNYAGALISLDPDGLKDWAAANGVAGDAAAVTASPEMNAYLQARVEELNQSLNKWERIKQFRVLPHDLTVEAGELTPSLKVKRKAVQDHYSDLIEDMFSGAAAG